MGKKLPIRTISNNIVRVNTDFGKDHYSLEVIQKFIDNNRATV